MTTTSWPGFTWRHTLYRFFNAGGRLPDGVQVAIYRDDLSL